jgi:hypothetical protein
MGGREGRGMEECGEYERLEKQNGVAEFGGRMVFVTYTAIGSMLCLDMMHSVAEKAPCRRRSKKVGLLRARAPACLVLAQTTKPRPNYKLGSNPGPTSASAPAGTKPPLLSLCTSAHTLRIITTHHVHRYSPLRIPLPLPPTQTTPPAAPVTTTPTPKHSTSCAPSPPTRPSGPRLHDPPTPSLAQGHRRLQQRNPQRPSRAEHPTDPSRGQGRGKVGIHHADVAR